MIFHALFLYALLSALWGLLTGRKLAYRYVLAWDWKTTKGRKLDRVAVYAEVEG